MTHPNPPLRGGAGVGCRSPHTAQPSVTPNHPTLCSSPKIGEQWDWRVSLIPTFIQNFSR